MKIKSFPTNMMSDKKEAEAREQAHKLVMVGMAQLTNGEIDASITSFDTAEALDPSLKAKLWQRGISYYYAGRYQEGADQFKIDLEFNPNDVEESIWNFMCNVKLKGLEYAQKQLLPIDGERRQALRVAFQAFKSEITPEELGTVDENTTTAHDRFYREFYAGLYYEVLGDDDNAKKWLLKSAEHVIERDYMSKIAVMHVRLRGYSL
jgi:lipoprotein NlpI